MTLYIGVDIHARQQTVSYLDTADGSTGQVVLEHEGDDNLYLHKQACLYSIIQLFQPDLYLD